MAFKKKTNRFHSILVGIKVSLVLQLEKNTHSSNCKGLGKNCRKIEMPLETVRNSKAVVLARQDSLH